MLKIENKIQFENKCWVGLVDSSTFNRSEKDRIKAVTNIASITKGRLGFDDPCPHCKDGGIAMGKCVYCGRVSGDINNISDRRYNLYKRLLKESAGNPSTPFEFVPVTNNNSELIERCYTNWEERSKWLRYKTVTTFDYYTNLRDIITNDDNSDKFNNLEEVKDFKIIVGRVPWKVISHLRTHRAFSWLVESSRNKKYLNEVEFWYPSWWSEKFIHRKQMEDIGKVATEITNIENKYCKPEEATMELSDRRLVKFAMCAWKQDTNAWDNLFAVRGNKTGTMSITGDVVKNIEKLINNID